jgi:hypothetical protein
MFSSLIFPAGIAKNNPFVAAVTEISLRTKYPSFGRTGALALAKRFVPGTQHHKEKREDPRQETPQIGVLSAPAGQIETKKRRDSQDQQQQKDHFAHCISSCLKIF